MVKWWASLWFKVQVVMALLAHYRRRGRCLAMNLNPILEAMGVRSILIWWSIFILINPIQIAVVVVLAIALSLIATIFLLTRASSDAKPALGPFVMSNFLQCNDIMKHGFTVKARWILKRSLKGELWDRKRWTGFYHRVLLVQVKLRYCIFWRALDDASAGREGFLVRSGT